MLVAIGMALAGRAGVAAGHRVRTAGAAEGVAALSPCAARPQGRHGGGARPDDVALPGGHRHTTVLIDMVTHRPVDMPDNRAADPVADWLVEHPRTTVICRARAGHSSAAAQGNGHRIKMIKRPRSGRANVDLPPTHPPRRPTGQGST